tara:strand:- start:77 stop:376 length:300 start_codon:yes stop_codon:yes gene_type:complete
MNFNMIDTAATLKPLTKKEIAEQTDLVYTDVPEGRVLFSPRGLNPRQDNSFALINIHGVVYKLSWDDHTQAVFRRGARVENQEPILDLGAVHARSDEFL